MPITYLIISSPDSLQLEQARRQLQMDVDSNNIVTQLFFYSDGVTIGGKKSYPKLAEELLELAEEYQIPLYICSAGFQKRQLKLSQIAEEDFVFKGLGQFIVESQEAKYIRTF